jgi:RNA polymerase sigma-70 factor (ECF subfamily)
MAARAPSDEQRRARTAPLVEWLAGEEWSALERVARRSGAPSDAVADVVQSALLSVLRSFPGPFKHDNVLRYACRCAQREAWDVARRRSRTHARTATTPIDGLVEEPPAPSDSEPYAVALRAAELSEARAALRELPAQERAALVLLAAGFERAQVRRALGVSERGLRKRVERGNRRLRER